MSRKDAHIPMPNLPAISSMLNSDLSFKFLSTNRRNLTVASSIFDRMTSLREERLFNVRACTVVLLTEKLLLQTSSTDAATFSMREMI
jgi:hypothetical protein